MAKLCLIFMLNLLIILILSSFVFFNTPSLLQDHFAFESTCIHNDKNWSEHEPSEINTQ